MIRRPRPEPDPVGPGEESVWSYPRPPALVACTSRIDVVLGGEVIARTDRSWRVLETSHPPTYYLPPDAFVPGAVAAAEGSSFCEWKGVARYATLTGGGRRAERAAWSYPTPTPPFAPIAHHLALYPALVDSCTVDGELVEPQPGGFYGGWITSRVRGPFKGGPGSSHW